MLRKNRHNYSQEQRPVNTSESFLKLCRKLIFTWFIIFVLLISTLIWDLVSEDDKAYLIKGLFTATCLLDLIVTLSLFLSAFKRIKDEVYKEKTVKRTIRKLRLLVILNLLWVVVFTGWPWIEIDPQWVRWVLFAILLIGFILVKGLFYKIYRFLKKHIHNLFAGFTVIRKETYDPEVVSAVYRAQKEEALTLERAMEIKQKPKPQESLTSSNTDRNRLE